LIFINFDFVQNLINLTQDAMGQAFIAFVSKLSTELSTDSVDNTGAQKRIHKFASGQAVKTQIFPTYGMFFAGQ